MILNVATNVPMIVCLCANVTERELAAVVAAGARTVKEVGRCSGAGTGCGACKPLIRECLAEARAAAGKSHAVAALAAPAVEPATV